MAAIESYEDLILWLLYVEGKNAPFEGISGRTRLVKMIFIFEKEVKKLFSKKNLNFSEVDEFEPLHYGPFNSRIYKALDFLKSLKFISVKERTNTNPVYEENVYHNEDAGLIQTEIDGRFNALEETFLITQLGKDFVEANQAGILSENQIELLTKLKSKINSMSLKSLLHYVYKNYPEQIGNSVIKEQVLGDDL